VVVGVADVRKLKADPIIVNPPSLAGGGGALSSSLQCNSRAASRKDAYQSTRHFLHACDFKKKLRLQILKGLTFP
jgi:hypothetical protein